MSLPGSDDPSLQAPPPEVDGPVISAAQLAWKSQLIAGLVAARNPAVVGFDVSIPDATPSDAQRSYLHTTLRRRPGLPTNVGFDKLGTVSVDLAKLQLQSNLAVLSAALPVGTIESSRITVVPVDSSADLFGLAAEIKVDSLNLLRPQLGDVVAGLATGLIGNRAAVVEGLAINVIDDRGRRAAWWRSARAGVGMGVPGLILGGTPYSQSDTLFPVLTGGPPTIQSVSDAPVVHR